MSKILLGLRDLSEGTSRFELEEDVECLELRQEEYIFHSPVVVRLQVTKSEQEFLVEGDVSIAAQVECARCAGLFAREVRASFTSRFVRRRGELEGQRQLSDEGDYEVRYDEPNLDLTDEVRQAVVLSLPIRALCSPACKGLCPTCGANLNEEPCSCGRTRGHPAWSALEKLKDGGGET